MRLLYLPVISLLAFCCIACSEKKQIIELIDPIVVEVLVKHENWIIVQSIATAGEREDVSYSISLRSDNGKLSHFQCFSKGTGNGWLIQDHGELNSESLSNLHPDAGQASWSDLSKTEQASIADLTSQIQILMKERSQR